MMVRELVVVVLVIIVVFVGCGEDELDKVKPKEDEGPAGSIIWKKDGAKMALIPAGSFEMGDHFPAGIVEVGDHLGNMDDALPVHRVELDAFYMDIHEVTVGQFKRYLKSDSEYWDVTAWWPSPNEPTGSTKPITTYSPMDEDPMFFASWDDAEDYARWAGKRLPTEAEWEYAARGGLVGKKYSWGDDESVAREYANYDGISAIPYHLGGRDQWDETAPVGAFKPNGYGLHDMVGNVYEWCSDWYGSDYYSSSPSRNPQGPSSGRSRVMRGGSWRSHTYWANLPLEVLRVACRAAGRPTYRDSSYGFRCVAEFPAAQ